MASNGCGWLIGRMFGWLTFKMHRVPEFIHCYGISQCLEPAERHRNHEFQRDGHDITEQVERWGAAFHHYSLAKQPKLAGFNSCRARSGGTCSDRG